MLGRVGALLRELPPPTSPQFYKPTYGLRVFTLLTIVEHWYAHFDPTFRKPVRCGGTICSYCDRGRQKELRFVVGMVDQQGGRYLFELRERHRRVIQEWRKRDNQGIGSQLRISKAGQHDNAPVEVELGPQRPCDEWDIRLLIPTLGITDQPTLEVPERSEAPSLTERNGPDQSGPDLF